MKRFFTKEGQDVLQSFKWKKIECFLPHGEKVKGEFPANYSQTACNIIAGKYFKKAKGIKGGSENSLKQVFTRMANFWVASALDEGIITKEEESIFRDECLYLLCSQSFAPNSPQWFNTGLKMAYDLDVDPDGMFYFDEKKGKVVSTKDRYTRTQAAACFITGIEDTLLGEHSISEQYVTETKLFKGGSGVGTNFSNLRAEGEKLSVGGVSSGLMSFLEGLDRNAGAIKSGGTTRRAAKIVVCDVDHPEIMDFISWKANEEDKVVALGKMGYDTSMDGAAYKTVSGQNSNNSVRVDSAFMDGVINHNDELYTLKGRTDRSADKKIPVKDIWDNICYSAWRCGDPGLQFSDTLNVWLTCPIDKNGNRQEIRSSNPCGEYVFIDNSSCNLASINLLKFYKDRKFDVEGFKQTIDIAQTVLEASNHWGQYPTKDIAKNTYMYRPNGLGMCNLASLLMLMGLPYDSEAARNVAGAIASVLTGESYYISSQMAERVKPFPMWHANKEHMNRVLNLHAAVSGAESCFENPAAELDYDVWALNRPLLKTIEGMEELEAEIDPVWKNAITNGTINGYRNAQVTVIAPTGTISFAMDVAAPSIEPFFSHKTIKSLSGGGTIKISNPIIEDTLKEVLGIKNEKLRLEISEQIADGNYQNIDEKYIPLFASSSDISAYGHIMMIAAITPMISGSISKTVNMPNDTTPEEISKAFITAYTKGAKAITIYRDGSKESQPLQGNKKTKEPTYKELEKELEKIKKRPSMRLRPDAIRRSVTHSATIDGVKLYLTLGFYEDGRISEIFVSTDKEGTVIKGLLATLSKSLSNMLQYNVPADEISKMLRGQKYEPAGFVSNHPYIKSADSISDLISKVIDIELGDYTYCQIKPESFTSKTIKVEVHHHTKEELSKGEKVYGQTCANCGSDAIVSIGSCKFCSNCGSGTGCS